MKTPKPIKLFVPLRFSAKHTGLAFLNWFLNPECSELFLLTVE